MERNWNGNWILLSIALMVGACTSPEKGAGDGGDVGDLLDDDIDPSGLDGSIDKSKNVPTFSQKEGDKLPGFTPGQCTLNADPAPFKNPATEFHWNATTLPFSEYVHAVDSPIVVDFIPEATGDVVPEIIFVSYKSTSSGGVLRVVSGRPPYTTLMTLAGDGSLPNTDVTQAAASLKFDGHPAAADLDGDGKPEVVALRNDGGLMAFKNNGSTLWSVSPGASTFSSGETGVGSIAIANIDKSGSPEVIIGRLVLNGNDGSKRWVGTGGKGINSQGPLSCVADLDETGGMEIIAGDTVYDSNGNILWRDAAKKDGFCAVADILNNGTGAAGKDQIPEVIRVAAGVLYIHDARSNVASPGKVLWSKALPACNDQGLCTGASCPSAGSGGAPTVADFDGDGLSEIGVAGANCYAVFDPACVSANPAIGCVAQGIRWATKTEDDSSNVTSSTVFDFNGDGRAEVVYNDEQRFLVLDGLNGSIVFFDWNPSRTRTEQPVVADVDNDGNAEIVFVANTEASFAGNNIPSDQKAAHRIPGVEIWSSADDSWVGARTIWNQHTYHIDNISVSGGVPAVELPSWKTHNTYRLNVAEDDPLAAPDLGSKFATATCSDATPRACVQLSNYGDIRVGPGVKVTFYESDPASPSAKVLGSVMSTRNIDPGKVGETVCIDLPKMPPETVFLKIDANNTQRECVEDNNVLQFKASRCTTEVS